MAWDSKNPNNPWESSFTSSNGLTTTGTMNPFGLKTNATGGVVDPYSGYNANPATNPVTTPPADNGFPTLGSTPSAGNSASQGTYQQTPIQGYQGSAPSGFNSPITSTPGQVPSRGFTPNSAPNPYIAPSGQPTPPALGNYTGPSTPMQVPNEWNPSMLPQGITGTPSTGGSYGDYAKGFNTPPVSQNTPQDTTQNTGSGSILGKGFTDFSDSGDFIQGGLVRDQLYPNGQPVNAGQYATPQLTEQLASLVGGKVVSDGSFNGQNEIQLPNGYKFNAGLFADLVSKYGPDRAVKLLMENDASHYGQTKWETQKPYVGTPQQSVPQNSSQNNTGDFMSQLMNLFGHLQKLGLFTQRPPAFPQANSNSNYFSQFA